MYLDHIRSITSFVQLEKDTWACKKKRKRKKERKMHEKTYFEESSVRERVTKRNRNMRLHT